MSGKYKPFINIGPGFYIEEELESRGWSKGDLATILDFSQTQVSEIIHNKRPITFETAKLLSSVFGQSTQYWQNLYMNYKLREEGPTQAEYEAEVKAKILTYMPIADMVKKGWLGKWNGDFKKLVKSVKEFWGIEAEEMNFSFLETQAAPFLTRKSDAFQNYNQFFALTWFRMAKICAKKRKVPAYNKEALVSLANKISEYSYRDGGIEMFLEELENAGVKFFVLQHLEKTYTDGAAFWDCDSDNPVIVWTGRYKREDNFWFTISHEIAHIILHFRSKNAFFIDSENLNEDKNELEANEFAASVIKRKEILASLGAGRITSSKIRQCSKKLKISTSVIVGQLMYLGKLEHYQLRSLINTNILDIIPSKYSGVQRAA